MPKINDDGVNTLNARSQNGKLRRDCRYRWLRQTAHLVIGIRVIVAVSSKISLQPEIRSLQTTFAV